MLKETRVSDELVHLITRQVHAHAAHGKVGVAEETHRVDQLNWINTEPDNSEA